MLASSSDTDLGLATREQVQMEIQMRRKRSLDAQIERRRAKRARTEEVQIANLDRKLAALDSLNAEPVRAREIRFPELLPQYANVNDAEASRLTSALACFKVFFTDEMAYSLATQCNFKLHYHRPGLCTQKVSRFRSFTHHEIWKWIAQRLTYTLTVRSTLDAHYFENKPRPKWWLSRQRLYCLQNHMRPDILNLGNAITQRALHVWHAGALCVIDQSLYAFLGESPVHMHIPRKPHPNGLLSYGLASNSSLHHLPVLLAIAPHTKERPITAPEAVPLLLRQLKESRPDLTPHLILNSVFGSLDALATVRALGAHATMSISSGKLPDLWEAISTRFESESGYTVSIPIPNTNERALASLYQFYNRGDPSEERTLTSGFSLPEDSAEAHEREVIEIVGRRFRNDGGIDYLTRWSDGNETFEPASRFIDPSDVFNEAWLRCVCEEEICIELDTYSIERLQFMCQNLDANHNGTREKLSKRIAKLILAPFSLARIRKTRLENRLPPRTRGPSETSGMIHQLYSDNYGALEQFDAAFYEIEYPHRDLRWRTCFAWSLITTCVVNARACYCECNKRHLSMTEFTDMLVSELSIYFNGQ